MSSDRCKLPVTRARCSSQLELTLVSNVAGGDLEEAFGAAKRGRTRNSYGGLDVRPAAGHPPDLYTLGVGSGRTGRVGSGPFRTKNALLNAFSVSPAQSNSVVDMEGPAALSVRAAAGRAIPRGDARLPRMKGCGGTAVQCPNQRDVVVQTRTAFTRCRCAVQFCGDCIPGNTSRGDASCRDRRRYASRRTLGLCGWSRREAVRDATGDP